MKKANNFLNRPEESEMIGVRAWDLDSDSDSGVIVRVGRPRKTFCFYAPLACGSCIKPNTMGLGHGGYERPQTPHEVSQNWVGDKVAVIMATTQTGQLPKKILETPR